MSCKQVILDLTNDTTFVMKLPIEWPLNVEHVLEFEFDQIDILNGGHKITIEDEEYTIGNGLEIVDNKLLWSFTRTAFGANVLKMKGYMEGLTLNDGKYYRYNINIHVA